LASGYPGAPANCNVPTQKDWPVDYMNDDYYWFDKMGRRNDAATGPADFLDSLIYQPLDRYSAVGFTRPFGDPAERRLSAALNYIQTGTCPALASKAEAHSAQAPFASRLLNPRRKLALMQ
jgi:hypothetical protein